MTGASQGSIAAGIAGQLLAGGATVIATTSGLDPKRLAFYRELYRTHAINGAALWVVPANMASFADVDALTEWIGAEQTQTRAGTTTVLKPAMTPTLLFPFAAGRVAGDMSEAGSRTEIDMRILLWSVERLITSLSAHGQDHDIDATLHVVLPGSPNRGMFGGDGGYGEAKSALDALVTRWKAEPAWADRVTLSHAIIGWVRGTGLMGGNDPLVEAVEAAGVRTWTPDEMAEALLETCTPAARAAALIEPLTVDLTGGLGGVNLDMRALAEGVERPATEVEEESRHHRRAGVVAGTARPRRHARMGARSGPSRGPRRHGRCRRARPVRLLAHPLRGGGVRRAVGRRHPRAGVDDRARRLGHHRRWLVRHRVAGERRRGSISPTATKRRSAKPVASAATSTKATWSTTLHRC